MAGSAAEIPVFVQARMTSQRLPGKVMLDVAGQPLLAYLMERLAHCHRVSTVIVLTSREASDDPVADFCQQRALKCFRGDLHNVARRFADALDHYGFEGFARISGDSPLLDQALVDQSVDAFLTGNHDMVTNVFPRSYPTGQSVEVVSAPAFRRALSRMSKPSHVEHVTSYFYENHQAFSILNISAPAQLREIRLSVDTRADYEVFCRIVGLMEKPHWQYSLSEVVELYRRGAAQAGLAALT